MDLTVNINGITFPNPLIVASGPLTLNPKAIIKCFEHGAGGAVTKTITYDPMQQSQPRPRMHVLNKKDAFSGKFYSFFSIDLMSEYKPEKWSSFLRKVKKSIKEKKINGVLIASIAGRNYKEWEMLAELVSDAGADAIELNLSCPHIEEGEKCALMGRAAVSDPNTVKAIIKIVKEKSNVPVWGKLTPHGANPEELAKIMVSAGVDSLVSIARFQGLIIDIESLKVVPWEGYGGYGGPWQLPISLSWTAHIVNENLGVPVIGSGGITSREDIVRFLLVGADAVQSCTAIMLMGREIILKMVNQLKDWMSTHNFAKIDDFKGKALKKIVRTESLNREKIYKFYVTEKCTKCGICVKACPYEAISLKKPKKANIDVKKCDNCGLCFSVCPFDAINITKIMG